MLKLKNLFESRSSFDMLLNIYEYEYNKVYFLILNSDKIEIDFHLLSKSESNLFA